MLNSSQRDRICWLIIAELVQHPAGLTTAELILSRDSPVYESHSGYVFALVRLRNKRYIHTVAGDSFDAFVNVLTAEGWLVWARERQEANAD